MTMTRREMMLGAGAVGATAVLGTGEAAASEWEQRKAAFWQRMRNLGRETTLHLPRELTEEQRHGGQP